MAFDTPNTQQNWSTSAPAGSLLEDLSTLQAQTAATQGLSDPEKDKDAETIQTPGQANPDSLLESQAAGTTPATPPATPPVTTPAGTTPPESVGKPVAPEVIEAINGLADEGVLDLFESREIKTVDDLKDLLAANIEDKISAVNENIFNETMATLPPQFQSIIKYGLDGGQDVQKLVQQWAATEQAFSLDVTTDEGKADAIRQYLTLTGYGSPEVINKDIETWKGLNMLDEKVAIFKPKLEQFHVEQVKQIENQAQEAAAQTAVYQGRYTEAVGQTLAQENLNGLVLPREIKQFVYENTQPLYQSQLTGQPVDALQAIVEELKFGAQANPAFYAELLLHATQPEVYRELITNSLKENVAVNTERTLRRRVNAEVNGGLEIEKQAAPRRQTTTERW